jgi:hypothetical protein
MLYTYVFQMSSSSGHAKLDETISDSDSDDDDFMVVYAGLELMADNYDSCANKARTVHVMSGIVWAEIQLTDRDKCYETFRMRKSVFHLLHETLVSHYGLQSTRELCSKEALAIFLWTLGAPQSNRTVKKCV